MFVIFYNKATKEIVSFRNDTSVPQPMTAQYHFDRYCKDGNLDDNLFSFAEAEWNPELAIGSKTHLYNELTKQVQVNPNWVPLTPDPVPEITPTV